MLIKLDSEAFRPGRVLVTVIRSGMSCGIEFHSITESKLTITRFHHFCLIKSTMQGTGQSASAKVVPRSDPFLQQLYRQLMSAHHLL